MSGARRSLVVIVMATLCVILAQVTLGSALSNLASTSVDNNIFSERVGSATSTTVFATRVDAHRRDLELDIRKGISGGRPSKRVDYKRTPRRDATATPARKYIQLMLNTTGKGQIIF